MVLGEIPKMVSIHRQYVQGMIPGILQCLVACSVSETHDRKHSTNHLKGILGEMIPQNKILQRKIIH